MVKILVPIDGSPQSTDALDYALDEFDVSEILLLHVIDLIEAGYSATASVPGYTEEWYEQQQAKAEELFEAACEHADGADMETATEIGRPSRAIVEYAEEHDIDHIVMGSHGRSGVTRILLGSVAETVVRRSPVPVTIVR